MTAPAPKVEAGGDGVLPSDLGSPSGSVPIHRPARKTSAASLRLEDHELKDFSRDEEKQADGAADPFLVTFSHPSAAHLNPLALPKGRKYALTTLVSLTAFTRILISTLPAPALPAITASLDLSPVEAVMSMSIYLLATAVGPLLISPLSELYGRSAVLHATNAWFLAWNLTCGLAPTKGVLMAARFLAGLAASAAYAVGTGVVGDIWTPEQRGRSLQYYSVIPLIGAATGPILGGVITEHLSWRWIFYSTSIFQGCLAVVFVLFFRETYAPTILARHAARLRKQHGDERYMTLEEQQQQQQSQDSSTSQESDERGSKTALQSSAYILRALSRPVRFLLLHPIVQICGICMAVGYGTLYIILTSLAALFQDVYHVSTSASGLHYLAAALGELVAAQLCGPLVDRFYARQQQKKKKQQQHDAAGGDVEVQPEETRMPLVLWACLTPCIGLLLYGWGAASRIHWFAVDAGVFLAALGLQVSGMPRTAYLIDAYPAHVSSVIAATQFLGSMAAFLFPLFTPALYGNLGYGWGNTLVAAVVAVVGVPGAWVLWRFGARMRQRSGGPESRSL